MDSGLGNPLSSYLLQPPPPSCLALDFQRLPRLQKRDASASASYWKSSPSFHLHCLAATPASPSPSHGTAPTPGWWSPPMPLDTTMLVTDVRLSPPVCLDSQRPTANWQLSETVLEASNAIAQVSGRDASSCEGKHSRAARLCSVLASSPLCNCSSISNSKIICFCEEI